MPRSISKKKLYRVLGGSFAVISLASMSVLPAAAEEHIVPIEIVVQVTPDPCAGYNETVATWTPDTNFTYTSAQQVNSNPFTIEGFTSVQLSMLIGWTDGDTCVEGTSNPVGPTGNVTAVWAMDTLPFSYKTCEEGCGAGVTGLDATIEIDGAVAAGTYNGSLTLTWIP